LSDEKDVAGFKAAQDIYDVINTIMVKDKLPEPPQLLVGAVRDLLNFNVNLYFVTSCVNAHVLWKHMVQLISSSKRNGTYSVRAYLIVVSRRFPLLIAQTLVYLRGGYQNLQDSVGAKEEERRDPQHPQYARPQGEGQRWRWWWWWW
jgi:hypothetical protein